jgi:putative phosphoesterase
MRICHISDTHVCAGREFRKEIFIKTIDRINSENFDLVIHSGDLTNSGRLDEYVEAKKLLKRIRPPLVIVPGNHDARNGGIHLFKGEIGSTSGILKTEDALVSFVNSSVPDSDDGRVGMVKFRMLNQAFIDNWEKPVKIVVIHHHIIPIPMAGRERNILSNAGDLLDLFLRYDVDLVLSGHRHYPNVHKVGNTLFINAGTLSSQKTRYGDVNSYGVIEIENREFKLITRRLNGEKNIKKFFMSKPSVFTDLGRRMFRMVQISNSFITGSEVFLKKHFRNAIRSISGFEPDLVVHCGGLVYEGIARNYLLAKGKFADLKFPKLFSPAGRDINYLGYHLFGEYFGNMDQSFTNGDVIVKGISTAQYDSINGIVGPTEIRVLLRELNESEENFKAVMFHHNIIPIPHSREKGLLEDSGDILRKLVDAKVDLVMTGASSHPYAVKVGETLIVNANSLSGVYQRSIFGNSYNLIDIFERAVAVSEVNSLWGRRRLIGLWKREW